jgi:hypothetical protein
MLKGTIRIFISANQADDDTVSALRRHLQQAFPHNQLLFWNNHQIPPEEYRSQANAFLEQAHLFIPLISVQYSDHPDTRWELLQAIDEHHRRQGNLKILVGMAKSAFVPESLGGFPVSPGRHEPIIHERISIDRQLLRVAQHVRHVLAIPVKEEQYVPIQLGLVISDVQERLDPLFDRIDFSPVFRLIKQIGQDPTLLKNLFEAEDAFQNLYQQTRGLKTSLHEFLQKKAQHRQTLRLLIENMRATDLAPGWEPIFIQSYYKFHPEAQESVDPYFFQPTEEISIPETLNLPGNPGELNSVDNIGILSYQQKNDFRRNLLLAQDAIAVENYARAHALSEHVRAHIDPQSAQLYEYLLISYLHKEKSEKIIAEALQGEARKLNYITLYTGRIRLYQDEGKCPTQTGAYNRRVAAEILADGMKNVYEAWPNDAILDTGQRAERAPDNQPSARYFIEAAQLVYRAVHPTRGAFRLLINELCGGGKFNWISKLVLSEHEFRFLTTEKFDLESQIFELIELVEAVDAGAPDKQFRQRVLLRENLYLSLRAKRQLLAKQVAEEHRTQRHFTDVYESVIRFVQACLLGDRIFGEASQDGKDQSFLRLAIEYLLPALILEPDPDALLPGLRWFDLDEQGQLCAHANSQKYQFDARAIIEKIVREYAGKYGWMQVNPNIQEEVYEEYIADTNTLFEQIKTGLAFEDFRKIPELEARKQLIVCMKRWQTIYCANPEKGQEFLDRIIREITGGGLLLWLYHDPQELVTHPDSLAFGYDARHKLQQVLLQSTHVTESILRQIIADNLFEKRIIPAFLQLEKDNEAHRDIAVILLMETLSGFRLHADARYLDFVYHELSEERCFRWIDINIKGQAMDWGFNNPMEFEPTAVIASLCEKYPDRYRMFQLREKIAAHRYADIAAHYFHEISEFKQENRRPEREITIGIIQKCKAIYLFMPKEEYLQIPLKELSGNGRIRWNAAFFGILPTRENHFENNYYNFNYRYEYFDCKRLISNHFEALQRVMKETGELQDDPEQQP